MTARVHQQASGGYSIVEMGIALAVLGLLLGSILVPLGSRLRAEKNSQVQDQLMEIKDSLLGYALTHRNSQALAVYDSGTISIREQAVIPGGRPYLPCPDVNGDGLEDRLPPPVLQTGLQSSRDAEIVTFLPDIGPTVVVSELQRVPLTLTLSNTYADNQLHSLGSGFGSCIRDKGMLPWATLGTHVEDPWGNRFTYRVDPMFSNSVLGFGAETRSDVFDPRMPLELSNVNPFDPSSPEVFTYQRRVFEYIVKDLAPTYELTSVIDENPGIVCTATHCSESNLVFGIVSSLDSLVETGGAGLTLFSTHDGLTLAKIFQPSHEVVSGMAFTVVSHGQNGFGAVPHADGTNYQLATAATGLDAQNLRCNEFVGNDRWADYPEYENADRSEGYCGLSSLPAGNLLAGAARNHSFVSLPHHDRFDDELVYMRDLHLIEALKSMGASMDQAWIPPGP